MDDEHYSRYGEDEPFLLRSDAEVGQPQGQHGLHKLYCKVDEELASQAEYEPPLGEEQARIDRDIVGADLRPLGEFCALLMLIDLGCSRKKSINVVRSHGHSWVQKHIDSTIAEKGGQVPTILVECRAQQRTNQIAEASGCLE